MKIIKHRKIWFTISGILAAASILAMLVYGFNLSIDFRGGTITEVRYETDPPAGEAGRPAKALIEESLSQLGLGGFSVRPSEDDRFIIRTRELAADEGARLLESLPADNGGAPALERANTVGPVAGAQLQRKAVVAVVVVILMIVLFVTFAFRKASRHISSWKYGLATIVALFHDVLIPTGIFVALGALYGFEIDLLFITGLLAILGYSVNDTIVVFDRVRENLHINGEKKRGEPFDVVVGHSVSQTIARSINTSFTLLLVLVALYFIGSTATKDFALLLIIGVIVGTYSSIFLASPLLVTFAKLGRK